jgi:Bacteriophage replication gene A protein (GPA)
LAGHNQNYHLPVYLSLRGEDRRPTSIPFNAEPRMEYFPRGVQDSLEHQFYREYDPSGWPQSLYASLDKLARRVDGLVASKLSVAYESEETHVRAAHLAELCWKLKTYHAIKTLADAHQLDLPLGNRESTQESIAARCYETKTWRKIIDRTNTRKAENHLRELGFVERGKALYCTNQAVTWYRSKMRAQEAYLRSRTVDDGTGTQLELWEVHQKSLANKSNRRTELMTRMRGFEDYAKTADHVATFFTLTAPSAFHARAVGRGHNPLFAGGSVRDAQQWLSRQWAKSRAALAKRGLVIYGFRVAEPHHDGTPHWHLVLFCAPGNRDALCDVLREKWLSEYADEPGALVHRCKSIAIVAAKGSATGYLSKYIAKNIDGFGVEGEASDEDDTTPIKATALRVTAWASLHGIRQFQQIGGPSVGPYRELRRQRTPVDLPTLEPARLACDSHLFGEFIRLNGGVEVGRHGRIRAWKQTPIAEWLDETSGEVTQKTKQNAYGEDRAAQVVGVMSVSEALETRTKQWRIIRKCGTSLSTVGFSFSAGSASRPDSGSASSISGAGISTRVKSDSALGPVSITVAGAAELADPMSWTNPNETSTYGPH